jgi:major type 1 subunit fimbrin (pilin)
VEVQLLNGTNSTPMPLNAATATAQNSPVGTVSSSGAATLSYAAQYIAVGGAATAGLVNTSVSYTINYL